MFRTKRLDSLTFYDLVINEENYQNEWVENSESNKTGKYDKQSYAGQLNILLCNSWVGS